MNILYPFVALFYLYMLFESSSLCFSYHTAVLKTEMTLMDLAGPWRAAMTAPTALVTVCLWGFSAVFFPKSYLDSISFLSDTLSLVAPLVLPDYHLPCGGSLYLFRTMDTHLLLPSSQTDCGPNIATTPSKLLQPFTVFLHCVHWGKNSTELR